MDKYFNDFTNSANAVFDPLKLAVAAGRVTLVDPTNTGNTSSVATVSLAGVKAVSNVAIAGNRRSTRLKFLVKSGSDYWKYNTTTGVWEAATNSYVDAQLHEALFSEEALSRLPTYLGQIFDFAIIGYFMGDPAGATPYLTQIAFEYDKLAEGVTDVVDLVNIRGREVTAEGLGLADTITITLSRASLYNGVVHVDNTGIAVKTDANGNWSADLVPNHETDVPKLVPFDAEVYSYYTVKTKTKTYEVVIDKTDGASQTLVSLETKIAFVARVYP